MTFSLQDKIEWGTLLPKERYPIYDLHFEGKTPPIFLSVPIWQAALIERSMPLMRFKNVKGVFADNRKRPRRLRKKLWNRLGFRKNRPRIDPVYKLFINGIIKDLNANKSPYMQDQMLDIMTSGFDICSIFSNYAE